MPGVQPPIVVDEFFECEAAVRADPRWQEAMRKRGVTDFSPHHGRPVVGRATSASRTPERAPPHRPRADLGAARIPATTATPDRSRNLVDRRRPERDEVVEVQDHGVVPLPSEDGNYA